VKPPTLSSPRSVKAPQDEIESRERSKATNSRPEEQQEVSQHGIAQGLEEWEHWEYGVVVEELGQPAVGNQQDLVEVANIDKPKDEKATEALLPT
jgi:hypothetical protein